MVPYSLLLIIVYYIDFFLVINDWAMVDLVKSREYLFSFFKQAEVQSLYSWIIKLLPDKSGPCVEGKLRSVTAIHLTHITSTAPT